MGKTSVETTTRTYTKDGKRYEETVVVETKEDEDGNVTKTTKTTTRTLDPYSTGELSSALEGSKTSRGGRKSSSSSSDSSPERTKTKTKSGKASGDSLLSKLRLKKGDKSDDDSSDDEDFVETVHKAVNEYRKKHGVNKLKLNKEMNKYAKEWAKKLAKDEKMSHRPEQQVRRERLLPLSSNSKDFQACVEGHTKQMGVGKARSAAGTKVFVVANFDPQGNWMGQFADQVPPVGGFAKASGGKSSVFKAKSRKSSSSSSDSSSEEDDFVADCLKAHNDYRKKHGVPLLKISKDLNKVAKDWADTIARKDVMQHRPNNQYGENIYCAWSSNPAHKIKGSEAVDSWYSEIKDFRFGREPADLRAGHFTQVVWRDSKELGVGTARSRGGKIYVVANYNPPGNMVGSFSTKVPSPK
ncbi:Golgi-associated plant pathogenesis-related protein 1 [Penaeus vannamei]|uniref:Golgi-associated plant pathogenesis-related protein 1 n=1 Tax=Penaeus vannamei TaxID=6689 RepID=A0A423T3S5_PENVA|nr:Golgi-associated plant pathogenesis-related protein 1 [Penaeus vannamei]